MKFRVITRKFDTFNTSYVVEAISLADAKRKAKKIAKAEKSVVTSVERMR